MKTKTKTKTHRKHLTDLDWVSLAVGDKSRNDISAVYRDETAYVATDGHRLHYSNGLPFAAPYSLSGNDVTFPRYRLITDQTFHYIGTLGVGADLLETLKAAAAFNKVIPAGIQAALVKNGEGGIIVKLSSSIVGLERNREMRVDPRYLFDALCNASNHQPIAVSCSDINGLGPIKFEHSESRYAVLMPLS